MPLEELGAMLAAVAEATVLQVVVRWITPAAAVAEQKEDTEALEDMAVDPVVILGKGMVLAVAGLRWIHPGEDTVAAVAEATVLELVHQVLMDVMESSQSSG